MTKGGMIIRLIDVVLIILLGFMGIADFTIKTQIKLPSGSKRDELEERKKLVWVEIVRDDQFNLIDEQKRISGIKNLSQLEKQLRAKQEEFKTRAWDMVLIIKPDIETPIQRTVSVLDICEKYNISKNIFYPSDFEL